MGALLANTSQPTDRDYLLSVFDELAKPSGTKDVFGAHNPIRELPNWLTGDAAGNLNAFFQRIEPTTGCSSTTLPTRSGTPGSLATSTRTCPRRPARSTRCCRPPNSSRSSSSTAHSIRHSMSSVWPDGEAGSWATGDESRVGFRMIDPTCGSGHFLLGSFDRILDRWRRESPARKPANSPSGRSTGPRRRSKPLRRGDCPLPAVDSCHSRPVALRGSPMP